MAAACCAIGIIAALSAAFTFVPWLHAHGLYLRDAVSGAAVAYDPARPASDPVGARAWWRLVTAMWVHLDWRHWLANVMAAAGLVLLLGRAASARLSLLVLVACGILVQIALWRFVPAVHWYGGLSGALHGLATWGALRMMMAGDAGAARIGVVIGLVVGIKVWLEQSWLAPVVFDPAWRFGVVGVAHAIGAGAGIVLWLLGSWRPGRRP